MNEGSFRFASALIGRILAEKGRILEAKRRRLSRGANTDYLDYRLEELERIRQMVSDLLREGY